MSAFGSTARADRTSTLISPASASGAAGTTRGPPAFCAAQSWAPCPTASSACGPRRATSPVTAVASAGSADAPGVSSMGAPSATAAEAAPACPPASPSAASTTTGALVYSAALAATASGTGAVGARTVAGSAGAPSRGVGMASRMALGRRAAGEHRAGRHQRDPHPGPPPGPAPPYAPITCTPTTSIRPGEPPRRPHGPTVGGPATLAQNYATGSLLRVTPPLPSQRQHRQLGQTGGR